ncbi:RHS repeat-associated core domain-containing protein [Chryseobacterium sp. CFS15]|uniref:RHS repeat domain-containing protein n=1 Tax=Chryseobacterium sp. CFS15 TaxID=2986946 RepID=UPI002806DB0D|nr:RHS repeat-associated core domain-containing protein [Chryseobacterium sp. CFS15]MDQ8142916.1 RHS repeat-associated core domain-containing protein [Chryseobacterium sp. CFS15]
MGFYSPFDVSHIYCADGSKLRKNTESTVSGYHNAILTTEVTDYLDGFQYKNTKVETLGGGGGPGDVELLLAAPVETRRAMEMEAFSLEDLIEPSDPGIINPIGGIAAILKTQDLQFFPTAEGFYDYQKDQYIYQYKDHLGNARVSFGKNNFGVLEITDANDYYPFGMNHLKTGNAFFGGSYKDYKYNGKELQESGMYDYGARFYMPDIGRWGVVDPLAEIYNNSSPFNYAANNPILFIDPDGRGTESTHTDKFGNVVAVYNDGDLGVYRHEGNSEETKQELNQKYSKNNTSGDGEKMGSTLVWNSFTEFDGNGRSAGKINFGSYQARDWLNNFTNEINKDLENNFGVGFTARQNYAMNGGNGDKYDYKSQNGGGLYAGSQISEGVYVSARDVGNFAAGRAASLTGQSKIDFMLNAGGFNLSGNSKWGLFFKNSYWKNQAQKVGSPTYGEDSNSNFFQRLGYENVTTLQGLKTKSKIIWGSK